MSDAVLGVIATSSKPDERRLALHPEQLERLDEEVRARTLIEEGYGERFGVADDALAPLVAGLRPRAALLAEVDVALLPKPQPHDLLAMREGAVLWGWPHLVQDAAMTQAAIDRRLTVIAWEAMNRWRSDGSYDHHVFHRNNELAGYASVLHAFALHGRTGAFGPQLRAAVISFGATGRGAVQALHALGVDDVTLLTQREAAAVEGPPRGATIRRLDRDPELEGRTLVDEPDRDASRRTAELLAEHDVVVNCVLQDPERPLIFVDEADLDAFAPDALFVDVSCDAGMGFSWARPTSFAAPTFTVAGRVTYAVDHSPSHLWRSATTEIGEALLPFVEGVLRGPAGWEADETLRRAVEVRDGTVVNDAVLRFQGRAAAFPHDVA